MKKSTEVSFVFLGTNSKNSVVHGSIMLQLLQLLRELILLELRVRENICMKLTSVGKNEARIHDCLGRGSSGTFLMTPLRVRSQVRPLGLHAHVLPAILAVEGSPEPRLSGEPERVGTSQKHEVKASETLLDLVPR